MSLSNSRLAFADCETLFDKALDSPNGARWQAGDGSYGDQMHFRSRMHQFRTIVRKDNKEIYGEGEPLYGRSVYDALTIRVREDADHKWWLYVVHIKLAENEIELLDADGNPTEAA